MFYNVFQVSHVTHLISAAPTKMQHLKVKMSMKRNEIIVIANFSMNVGRETKSHLTCGFHAGTREQLQKLSSSLLESKWD